MEMVESEQLAGPAKTTRRLSRQFMSESDELKLLLEEEFTIKDNSGTEPKANVHVTNVSKWVYPAVKTFRTYQFNIVRTALFENTLVTLPTGLGKTFIASTVMFNYYRWFTNGLIFFLAPTRPLVTQQVESFTNTITEVPITDI